MASVPVYCLCRLPYDVTRFMIECDMCQDWFHGSCVGVEEEKAAEIDLYHCPNCEVLHGPSIMKKRRGSSKGHDTHKGKPMKTGSPMFIRELRGRTFDSVKMTMKGKRFESIQDTEVATTVRLKALKRKDFQNILRKWQE